MANKTRTIEQQNFVVSPKLTDKEVVTRLLIMADSDNTSIANITNKALLEFWDNHYTVTKH